VAPTPDRSWHDACNASFEQMLNLFEPETLFLQLTYSFTSERLKCIP